jgi:hypothetical protein
MDHFIPQLVKCWLLYVVQHIQSQVTSSEICGGSGGTGAGSSPHFFHQPSFYHCSKLIHDHHLRCVIALISQHIITSSVYTLRTSSLTWNLAGHGVNKLSLRITNHQMHSTHIDVCYVCHSATQVSYQYYLSVSPADGHLYISNPEKHQVLRALSLEPVTEPSINCEPVVGSGERCIPGDETHCGDEGPARDAKLAHPKGQ